MPSPRTRTRGSSSTSQTPPAEPPAPAEPPRRSPLFQEPDPATDAGADLASLTGSLPGPLSSTGPSPVVGEGSRSGSDTRSTGTEPGLKRITKGQLKSPIRRCLTIMGGVLQSALTRDPFERAAGVWIPDDEDTSEMADPVVNIVHRRIPSGATSDVVDGIVLFFALVGYVEKQIRRRAEVRADELATGGRLRDRTGEGAAGPVTEPAAGDELAAAGVAS